MNDDVRSASRTSRPAGPDAPAAALTVVSWNVFNRNADPARITAFVEQGQADLIALQEVTDDHLAALRALPGYHLAVAEDFLEGEALSHLAVLSRRPLHPVEAITRNPGRAPSPSLLGRAFRWRECLDSLHVGVDLGGVPVRLVNLHLAAGVGPAARRAQLATIMAHEPAAGPLIVCGDFNSFGRPLVGALIGWALGYRVAELLDDEVPAIARAVAAFGLAPAHGAVVTHPTTRGRLDHIFVRGFAVTACAAERDRQGSDHRPLVATLALSGTADGASGVGP